MKREAMTHTKMKRLCRKLDIPLWQGVGLMESLWHLTARETPRGDIGKLTDEDIALAIDYRSDETKLIEAFVKSGWVDSNARCRLIVHDWSEHADDAIQLKLARAKLFFADGKAPKLTRLSVKERESVAEFYTPCAQVTDLCPQKRTEYALPEPEPEPEPLKTLSAAQPAAEYEPEQADSKSEKPEPSEARHGKAHARGAPTNLLNAALETEIEDVALRIHARHPPVRRCGIGEVKKQLRAILRRFPPVDRLATLGRVDQNHQGRCETEDWQKDGGQFAKALENWLAPSKERWDEPPPNAAREKAAEPARLMM